ncbi:MAG: hypothetical protein MRY83_00200 [Flavobacteriales bacterium]|nr:hypothetical protein [Flavobacteriales bacterium]
MKRIYCIIISILFIQHYSSAQNKTLTVEEAAEVKVLDGATGVVLVPFKPNMYKSEIDKEINAKTGLTHESIKQKMRMELALRIFGELKAKGSKKDVHVLADWHDETKADLRYVYESTALHYDYLKKTPNEPETYGVARVIKKAKKMIIKEEDELEAGARIEEGQVVAVYENKPKYMSVKISNPNMSKLVTTRYNANRFLFINQLDLLKLVGSSTDMQNKRIAKVHYSWMNEDGDVIEGGVAQAYFSEFTNSPERISETCFKRLAEQIISEKIGSINPTDNEQNEINTEIRETMESADLPEYQSPLDVQEKGTVKSDEAVEEKVESIKEPSKTPRTTDPNAHSKPFWNDKSRKQKVERTKEVEEDIMDDY